MHNNLSIEFVDVDLTGNINAMEVPDYVKAIVPVHFAGQYCNMERFPPNKIVIEDAAHAIGLFSNGHVGTHSLGSCISFYPTKNMTTIEGGAILTNFIEISETAKKLTMHGLDSSHISRYKRSSLAKPMAEYPGYKMNMSDVEAAVGIEQLKKLPYFLLIRKRIAEIYKEELRPYVQMLEVHEEHVWHMFIILVDNRDKFIDEARNRNIGVGIHYSPIIPAHPYYEQLTGYKVGQFPVAEYISNHCVSLPLYPSMTNSEIEEVIKLVKEWA